MNSRVPSVGLTKKNENQNKQHGRITYINDLKRFIYIYMEMYLFNSQFRAKLALATDICCFLYAPRLRPFPLSVLARNGSTKLTSARLISKEISLIQQK